MPRRPRASTGGVVYHVLNRGIAKLSLFEQEGDYQAFLDILSETLDRVPCRLLAYCLMPNHWHLLLWPTCDGELSEFMRLLTVTHTQRWHAFYETAGQGPIYQGRFKAFPVQTDQHFLTVARYVEGNALRANLVTRAEHWRWGSLNLHGIDENVINSWPLAKPEDWSTFVNRSESEAALERLRTGVKKGCPFGDSDWQVAIAERLGIESSLRSPGRPTVETQLK